MKKQCLTIVLFFLMGLASKSFGQSDPAGVKELGSKLGLSETLAASVYNAMSLNEDRISAVIKSDDIKPLEKQKQVKALIQEREEKVKSLLNADQWQKLVQYADTGAGEIRQEKRAEMATKRANDLNAQKNRNTLSNVKHQTI